MKGDREELLRRRLAGRARRTGSLAKARRAERPELSFGQRRIWFIDRLQPGSAAYTIPLAHRLRGEVHHATLDAALAAVVRRHEALRTRYPADKGEPYQLVEDTCPPLAFEDLSAADDPEARARAILDEETHGAFDLAGGSPLRARLLRLAPDDHVLLVTVHHIAFDGWSLGVFLRELSECYAALRAGRAPDLPEPPLQYADFAAWQHAHLTAERLRGHLEHWRAELDGAPHVLELPGDHPRPEVPSHRAGAVAFEVPAATADRLRDLARAHSASLFVVVLAAYQAVLGRHAAMDDLLVGVPVAGRDRRELENVIGFFAHTLPLRARLDDDPPFVDLVARVRETVLEGMNHQELPFDQLVEHVAPTRELGRSPLVQVLFNLLTGETGTEPGALRLTGLEVEGFAGEAASTRFDLECHVQDHGAGLTGRVVYAVDLFDRTTMEWFTEHLLNFVTAVADDPTARVSDISLVTDEELELMARWNAASDVM
ncbi:condensation domain-containing protein [Streptomyces sp. G45]|uniref:condensation domain-containing protein n=1 Tax=Streptomyces sp. G45 TaxID=3406627 RepID=UPI003C1D9CF8